MNVHERTLSVLACKVNSFLAYLDKYLCVFNLRFYYVVCWRGGDRSALLCHQRNNGSSKSRSSCSWRDRSGKRCRRLRSLSSKLSHYIIMTKKTTNNLSNSNEGAQIAFKIQDTQKWKLFNNSRYCWTNYQSPVILFNCELKRNRI